ncbi:thioesterase II family protein [Streptomyces mayteni]
MTRTPGPGAGVGGLTRYLARPPRPDARTRLVCLHHAGGAASLFRGWPAHLAEDVDVLPVRLPGRESRVRETQPRDMAELVTELDDELTPVLDEPHVLYGHSMGALIAHDLTLRRLRRGARLPDRLLVGACAAPPHARALAEAASLPDDDLTRLLLAGGGTATMLLDHPEWLRLSLALLRSDLRLCGSRRPDDDHPLPCPIEAFAGLSDALVPPEHVRAWARHTTAGVRTHWMPGGHFYTWESPTVFFHRLSEVLAPTPAASPG